MITKKIKGFFLGFIGLILVISFLWGWHLIHQPDRFPLKKVNIWGNYEWVSPDLLQRAILPWVSKGFFNLSPVQAKRALLAVPGIEDVSIRKTWPDRVDIHIQEESPVAVLPDGRLYSKTEKIFLPTVSRDLSHLPVFAGAEAQLPAIAAFYHSASFLALHSGLSISFVGCDELDAWTLVLDYRESDDAPIRHLTLLLGKDQPLDRFSRFLSNYQILKESFGTKIPVWVDLRYNLGFSVKFSSPSR